MVDIMTYKGIRISCASGCLRYPLKGIFKESILFYIQDEVRKICDVQKIKDHLQIYVKMYSPKDYDPRASESYIISIKWKHDGTLFCREIEPRFDRYEYYVDHYRKYPKEEYCWTEVEGTDDEEHPLIYKVM